MRNDIEYVRCRVPAIPSPTCTLPTSTHTVHTCRLPAGTCTAVATLFGCMVEEGNKGTQGKGGCGPSTLQRGDFTILSPLSLKWRGPPQPNQTQRRREKKRKRKGFLLEGLGYTFFFFFPTHSTHSIHYFKITPTHPLEITLSQTAKLSDRQIPIHELELLPQLACS